MTCTYETAGRHITNNVKFLVIKGRNSNLKKKQQQQQQQLVNLLKPTGHVMHQQFNIQQFYVLPTPYLCVLYLSENKQGLTS